MKIITFFILLNFILYSPSLTSQIIVDDLQGEVIGDFPSKWDLVQGSVEVQEFQGEKVIWMGDNAIIKPLSGSESYLSNDFIIEFDAYFDQVMRSITYQGYRLRFWDGGQDRKRASENAELSFSPIKFYRHGAGFNYKDRGDGKGQEHKNHLTELKGKDPLWRHILVDYNDGKLKVLMDKKLILNIPNYQFTPEMFSIEAFANQGKTPLTKAIKNISVYNRSMADSAEPNVVIITTPDTDQIVDIIPYDISTDTLKIKEKYGGKPMFLGKIKGDFSKKDKKIDLKESSTITIYTKNKTIINQRRAQGDLIVLPNHDKKAKVVSNKNGKVVMKIE